MGFVRDRDGRHQALYIDPTGRRRSAGTYNSKRAAEAAILRAETAKATKTWIDPRDGRTTFDEYVRTVWTPNRLVRPSTAATEAGHLSKHLVPYFGPAPLATITPTLIQGWVTLTLNRGAAPKTVRNVHGTLRSVLRRAVVDRYLDHNPASVTELPMVATVPMTILTPEQVDALLAAADQKGRTLLLLLSETGMRWGESQALRVQDVTGQSVTIARSMTEVSKKNVSERFVAGPTKSNKVRRIKLPSHVAEALAARTEALSLHGGDLLVGASATRPWSRGNFHNRVWRPALKAASLTDIRVHDLRHTHASWLLAGGADLKVVMDRLGHANLSTTQRYLHTLPDSDDVALDALDRIRNRDK